MRACAILLGIVVGGLPLQASCRGGQRTIRDWGLHRAWVVVEDCSHPERPEQLREIAWPGAANGPGPIAERETRREERTAVSARAPEVRAGMQVEVWSQDALTRVHLVGTALGTARVGERVAFRVRMDGVVRHGVVRGPATVELIPEGIGR